MPSDVPLGGHRVVTQRPMPKTSDTTDDRSEERRGGAGSVQSVDRAVSVLEILAKLGEAGVTEISEELGVHKSTAFRILGVLENRGLVEQERDRGKYYLGAGVLRLVGAAAIRLDISQEGQPVCRALAEDTGETANIAVLDGDAAVNIMQARGSAAVTAYNWLGRRTPLHATASGKVLLAHLLGGAPGDPGDPQAAAVHREHPDHGGRCTCAAHRRTRGRIRLHQRGVGDRTERGGGTGAGARRCGDRCARRLRTGLPDGA